MWTEGVWVPIRDRAYFNCYVQIRFNFHEILTKNLFCHSIWMAIYIQHHMNLERLVNKHAFGFYQIILSKNFETSNDMFQHRYIHRLTGETRLVTSFKLLMGRLDLWQSPQTGLYFYPCFTLLLFLWNKLIKLKYSVLFLH